MWYLGFVLCIYVSWFGYLQLVLAKKGHAVIQAASPSAPTAVAAVVVAVSQESSVSNRIMGVNRSGAVGYGCDFLFA